MVLVKRLKFLKTAVIICTLFFFRLFLSCCDCPNSLTYFDYSQLEIESVDNSGAWLTYGTDTMKSEAVAFKLSLSGNDSLYLSDNKAGFGFDQIYAMDNCECFVSFKSKQTIDSIKIHALANISDTISIGDEVTDLFLSSSINNTDCCNNLYITLNRLIEEINNAILYDKQTITFYLFFKQKVYTSKARFSVDIYFSERQIISKATPAITII